MIRDYDHQMFGSSEIMMPFLQGLDDREEFPIIDVIISFCRGEGGRMTGTRMEVSIGVLLHRYSSGSSEGSISHDKEWVGGVQHFDYRGGKECFLEFDECVPVPFSIGRQSPFWFGHGVVR